MASRENLLMFPDGVRLARLEEIPGPATDRAAVWAHLEQAHIVPGFTVAESHTDLRFRHYAEVNVDAPRIWMVFRNSCEGLLSDPASLITADEDREPSSVATGDVSRLLSVLELHQYQLAHDGFLQFGLVSGHSHEITEVFVTETKHFKVWLNDIERFRSIMEVHQICERAKMEFIDEYPRVTTRLPGDRGLILDPKELWRDVADLVSNSALIQ